MEFETMLAAGGFIYEPRRRGYPNVKYWSDPPECRGAALFSHSQASSAPSAWHVIESDPIEKPLMTDVVLLPSAAASSAR